MRKALVVGVDHYHYFNDLTGCVNDAKRITQMLKRNGDNSLNFDVKELCGCEGEPIISTANLKSQISELFNTSCDVALFYLRGMGLLMRKGDL